MHTFIIHSVNFDRYDFTKSGVRKLYCTEKTNVIYNAIPKIYIIPDIHSNMKSVTQHIQLGQYLQTDVFNSSDNSDQQTFSIKLLLDTG